MKAVRQMAVMPTGNNPRAWPDDGLTVTTEDIHSFLLDLRNKNRTQETTQIYQRSLYRLYDWLPEKKRIYRDTLKKWRDSLLEAGYAAHTINLHVSVANSFLQYCGRREFQIGNPLEADGSIQPELMRNEYLRLLSAARVLDKEREYLLIKVFCSTGLTLCSLPQLTVEAVQDGKIKLSSAVLHIPDCLREELLDYTQREGIRSGPVFVTKTGKTLKRTNVTTMIQRLCRDAQVPEEKANPRCLKKLYQSTQTSIQVNISLLVE